MKQIRKKNVPVDGQNKRSLFNNSGPMLDFGNRPFSRLKPDSEFSTLVSDLLIENEHVIGAYKSVRDGVVFTNHRLITIHSLGFRKIKRSFTSLPYAQILYYAVEGAGDLDQDPQLTITFPVLGKLTYAFKGTAAVPQILKHIAARTA